MQIELLLWLIGGIAIGQLLHSVVISIRHNRVCKNCGEKLPKTNKVRSVEVVSHDLTVR